MSSVASHPEREALEALREQIGAAMRALMDEVQRTGGTVDAEHLARLEATARRLSRHLAHELPPELDPAAASEIKTLVIDILDLLLDFAPERALDTFDELMGKAEAIRHVIRDALDAQLGVDESDPAAVVAAIDLWLPQVNRQDKATLLGMSLRSLQRRARGEGPVTYRMQLVARLLALLHRGWTQQGQVAWFHRRRAELGGKAPVDLLDDPGAERTLMELARRGRALHAA